MHGFDLAIAGHSLLASTLLFQTAMMLLEWKMRRLTLCLIALSCLVVQTARAAPARGCAPYAPAASHPELDRTPTVVLLCESLGDIDTDHNPRAIERYRHAVRVMARKTRVVPALFVRDLAPGLAQRSWLKLHPTAAKEREAIQAASGTARWRLLRKAVTHHAHNKEAVRNIVLTDAYLAIDDPATARYAFLRLGLQDFFDKDRIFLRRGDDVYTLARTNGHYAFTDGQRAGQRARLLVFDRVATQRLGVAGRRAWDLNRFRRAAGLRTFLVHQVGQASLSGIATLGTGVHLRAAAVDTDAGVILLLEAAPQRHLAVTQIMDKGRADAAIARGITLAGDAMVDEKLRFDEPRTEEGQQDGALRIAWRQAYAAGQETYEFNGDTYEVFTANGHPNVPQVCIDFVLDTVVRWGGGWWAHGSDDPGYTPGGVEFSTLIDNRRQVRKVIRFAEENPDKAELYTVPAPQRVPFANRSHFYRALETLAPELDTADIIVIYGLRDDGRNHWHSFQVYETDPMYGTALSLIGQAGVARIQPWDDIMRSAPARSVRYRIRINRDWLASATAGRARSTFATRLPQ
jgi:hypothetical protein